jgi:hypothetical protein
MDVDATTDGVVKEQYVGEDTKKIPALERTTEATFQFDDDGDAAALFELLASAIRARRVITVLVRVRDRDRDGSKP